ncbi:MAG: magnesium and cobalt transport protein CorA, partial [Leptospiraceae bacterium]|nr:magnesium and cobalt transport protein CorA [Leptospiraceae bacterium]
MEIAKKRPKKAGLPPGTIIPSGEISTRDEFKIISYNPVEFLEEQYTSQSIPKQHAEGLVNWCCIEDTQNPIMLENIGKAFSLHHLILEDIANTEQRVKLEDYDQSLFVVVNMINYDPVKNYLQKKQISFVLSDHVLLSFEDSSKESYFAIIQDRIKNSRGQIRKKGIDYLLYSLIDFVVDNYFNLIESIEEEIRFLQDSILKQPKESDLNEINRLKKLLVQVRRMIQPLENVLPELSRLGASYIKKENTVYFRDILDHVSIVLSNLDSLKEELNVILEIYLTRISMKLNEVMKVLTLISTIFIPLTFIA